MKMKRNSVASIAIALGTIVILAGVALLLSSDSSTYNPNSVKILARGTTDNGYQLEFSLPSDPGYYCPGVDIERIGSQIHFTFVRSPTRDAPDVDVPTIKAHSGNDAVVFPYPFNWPASGGTLELVDTSGRSLGTTTLQPKR